MKRLLLLFILFVSLNCFSQNSIWLEHGKNTLAVIELNSAGDNYYNYLYLENELKDNNTLASYLLISRDQKFWKVPIYIHGEFRSYIGKDILTDNIYLIGPMFELTSGKLGYINLQTMYRYDGRNNYQVSLLGQFKYKRFLYDAYIDSYGTEKFQFESENRFFFKIIDPISIGCNFFVKLNIEKSGIEIKPMGLIRIDI